MMGIYKITSPSRRIYIGQSVDIDRRFAKYNSIENTKEQPALVRSFIKYGVINHIFEVIEKCEFKELNNRERYWQEFYDVLKYGLNCQLVSTDILPMIVSEETKKKIGDGNRGKILSEKTKRKISENNAKNMLGKKHKPEAIKKLRDFNLGKKLSEETKLKMSKLECRCRKIIDVETNIIYNSITEVSKLFNINLQRLRYFLQTYKQYENFKYYIND
jgi:group I intron endonuclease